MSDIRGAGGGGGKGKGGSSRVAVEAPDSLRSRQYANVLDLIAEGEIEGLVDGLKSVYFDDTPLQNADNSYNFSGVTVEGRTGTQSQTPITGFAGAESETPVGVEVQYDVPVTRTITNPNTNSVRITVSIPQLTSQNTTNGDINGSELQMALDIQTDGGGFVSYPLRKIFKTEYFAIGDPSKNTVDADQFNIVVTWTPTSDYRPQTIYYKFQYRLVGDSTWLDYEATAFSGNPFTTNNQNTNNGYYGMGGWQSNGGFNWYNSVSYHSPAPQTKTFNIVLPIDQYEFRVLKTSGDGSVAITYGEGYFPDAIDIISGKTTSKYQRSYLVNLPAGNTWDIKLKRLTADSTSSALQNKTFWDSYTEIIDAKLAYPNSAIIGVQIDAEQFSRIPVRGYEIKGLKVKIPSNYNPLTRVYTGSWDGSFTVAWTDNPAWVLYDIVTNDRYGLGELIDSTMIDKWGLYTIAQYCDVLVDNGYGGLEPRFTCNLYLQTREQAYQVVTNIASIFRAMVYWSSGSIFVSQDAPKDVTQIFSAANVIDGMFSYSGSSGKVRHTVALVTWNDPEDSYRPKIEYVADNDAINRYGVVQTDIVAIGCTSRGQANRIGRWLIYSEQNETETITFKAGLDSVFIQAGDVIETNDANRSGKRLGGRVESATTTAITLDANITIETGKTYELSCRLPDGTVESRVITNAAGSSNVMTVASAFSAAPESYAMWIIAISDLVPEQWRVVSVSESGKNEVEITALAYRPDKFNAVEQDLILQPLPLSIVSGNKPITPENISVVESLYLAGIGVVGVKATIGWNTVPQATSYSVSYQTGNNAETILTTDRNNIEAFPLTEGRYTFKVVAVDNLGRKSTAAVSVVDILGKTIAPLNVSNFNVAPLGTIGLFTWDAATDLDVSVGGKVKFRFSPNTSATWDTAQDLVSEAAGTATAITMPLQAGIYFAKFIDSSGNLSTDATSIITDAANVMALNFVENVVGQPTWSGTKVNTQYSSEFGGLVLSSSELWDSDSLIDGDDLVDFGGGVASSGTYYLGEIDLLSVQTLRLASLVQARALDLTSLWDSDDLMDSTELVDSAYISDVSASIWYRASTDGTTYGDWQNSTLADVTARSYQFELRLTSDNIYHSIVVEAAEATVDVPDRIESGDDVLSGSTAKVITYTKPFIFNPAVGVSVQNMATGDYYSITSKSVNGFTISFYNASNVQISKTFDYIAKGF